MTQVVHVTGDIFDSTAPAIGHGVNIRGVMGSGIAVQFRKRFPEMYRWYKYACENNQLNAGYTAIWALPDGRFVLNIASQDEPGPNAKLEWLESGVKASLNHAEEQGLDRIALPRIGSGVGGLDQDEVEAVLTKLAESSPVDIEIWTLPSSS